MTPMRQCALIVILAALGACATPSAYAPAVRAGGAGFTETRIESDRYRVTYRGTAADPPAKIEDFALLRAAELTLGTGYDWFEVVARSAEPGAGGGGPRVSVGVGGASIGGRTAAGIGVGVSAPLGGERGAIAAVTLEVRLGRGEKPASAEAYDAREVQSAVRARM